VAPIHAEPNVFVILGGTGDLARRKLLPAPYRALAARIQVLEAERDLVRNCVFYLALPPAAFGDALTRLGEAGLNESVGWTRIVIEKPFGQDLASARRHNETAQRYFDESQLYRIDHYLGKELVQNLLFLRFSNTAVESLWGRDRINTVQIPQRRRSESRGGRVTTTQLALCGT